jgi:adenylate cyclase
MIDAYRPRVFTGIPISAAVREALGEDGGDAVSRGEIVVRGYGRPMTVWQLG